MAALEAQANNNTTISENQDPASLETQVATISSPNSGDSDTTNQNAPSPSSENFGALDFAHELLALDFTHDYSKLPSPIVTIQSLPSLQHSPIYLTLFHPLHLLHHFNSPSPPTALSSASPCSTPSVQLRVSPLPSTSYPKFGIHLICTPSHQTAPQ